VRINVESLLEPPISNIKMCGLVTTVPCSHTLTSVGEQDSITAFSKQDNELWTRHLLGLVTQTAVAGYVVSKSSWPNARLRAAMVLMFLCGFLKYAGRTYCLYSASPKSLRASSMGILSDTLSRLQATQAKFRDRKGEG